MGEPEVENQSDGAAVPRGAPPRRTATARERTALASEVRLRIIRLTHHRPLTNKELAERVAKDPATTLHHVRKLVAAGFLEAQPPRRGKRGSWEIPYRSTGLSWSLELGTRDAEVTEAMLAAFLGELADSGVDELAQTRLVVQVGEAARSEFLARLQALLDEFVARDADPGARRWAVYLAMHPCD